MIRRAQATDIHEIVDFLQRGYAKTHYALEGLARIDETFTKQLLVKSVVQHGMLSENGTWFEVVEDKDGICGLMLATLARVYVIGDRLMATDVLFLVDERAQISDAPELIDHMVAWAYRSPACIEVRCGTTNIISGHQRAGRMLEKLGLTLYGNIYRAALPDRHSERTAA